MLFITLQQIETIVAPIFQYIPDTKTLEKANYCVAEYGDGFIHFCLINKNDNNLIAQEYFRWELSENNLGQTKNSSIITWVQKNNILIDVYIHQPHFTLIPQSIKEDDKLNKDVLFLLTGQKDANIITENVDALQLRNIYLSNADQSNTFITSNNLSHKQHFLTCWLTNASKRINGENKIEVIFYPHYFLVTLWKENVLQLIKYISYKTSEDVLYNLLRLTDFYTLNNEETPIHIYGAIDLTSDFYQDIHPYFGCMNSVEKIESFQFSASLLVNCPAHLSIPLLSLLPCV